MWYPYPLIVRVFKQRCKKQSSKLYVRGSRLISPPALSAEFARRKERVDLPLGSVKMPVSLENRQTMIIGKPGSGKTQALRPILRRLIQRGEKGICYCNKGDYFSEFFNPDIDLLFTLINLLTRGRSKGACAFLGIQDDGQTEKIYTPQLRKSIDNACGNRVTFSLSGETAELESKYNIGECELFETNRSLSMGPHEMRDGIAIQEQKKREPLFLPSDIANLQDLTAIVRLKNFDFVLSEWQWQVPRQVHEPFILRADLMLENIMKSQLAIKQQVNKIDEGLELDIEPVG